MCREKANRTGHQPWGSPVKIVNAPTITKAPAIVHMETAEKSPSPPAWRPVQSTHPISIKNIMNKTNMVARPMKDVLPSGIDPRNPIDPEAKTKRLAKHRSPENNAKAPNKTLEALFILFPESFIVPHSEAKDLAF